MQLVCVSDTHNQHDSVIIPDGDVLIHSGDACGIGTMQEFLAFVNWIAKQKHKHKIYVPGNHDRFTQQQLVLSKYLLKEVGVVMLVDELIEIEKKKFYGSPYQPMFGNWAFNLPRGQLKNVWEKIPSEIDVLITHTPPHGILDLVDDVNVGCEELKEELKRICPKVHVFGHIHESYGVLKTSKTLFCNAACCDALYEPINPPIILVIN